MLDTTIDRWRPAHRSAGGLSESSPLLAVYFKAACHQPMQYRVAYITVSATPTEQLPYQTSHAVKRRIGELANGVPVRVFGPDKRQLQKLPGRFAMGSL